MSETQLEIVHSTAKRSDQEMRNLLYNLHDSNTSPKENTELELLSKNLAISPQNFVDVYVLGSVGQSTRVSTEEKFDIYEETKQITEKHLISVTRCLLWESARWVTKSPEEKELIDGTINKMLDNAIENKSPEIILSDLNLPILLPKVKNILERHNRNWVSACNSTEKLQEKYIESQSTQNYNQLITQLTLSHQDVHAAGGAVLELMLRPGQKHLAYELLLAQRSEDKELNEDMLLDSGSRKNIIRLQKILRQRDSFTTLKHSELSQNEKQLLIAQSLLNDEALLDRIDIITKNLGVNLHFFRDISQSIFYGDENPQNQLLEQAKLYIQVAVEKKTLDSGVIVSGLIEIDDYYNAIDIINKMGIYSKLPPITKANALNGAIRLVESGDFSRARNSIIFLETSRALDDDDIDEFEREKLKVRLKESKEKFESDTYENEAIDRILKNN